MPAYFPPLARVASQRPQADAAIVACTGASSIDFGCYRRRYRRMVALAGPGAAVRDLDENSRSTGFLRAACHQLVHGIGRDAGRRAGIQAFAAGDATCSSGYYHGVVEAVMARLGAGSAEREARRVCEPFRTRARHGIANYNCVHGMGHGFMGVYASDVFFSLKGCAALRDPWEEHHCVGGVFMENLTALTHPDRPSRSLRPDEPLYPCTAVAARYKHECYIKQTAYALYVRDDDFGAVFALCAATPDAAFRDDCYQGVGGDASIRASKYITGAAAKRTATRALCRLGPTRTAVRNCVIGAVTVIVRDGATRAANPTAFCRSLGDADLRRACARAHLETARDLGAAAGPPSWGLDFRGRGQRFVCALATRLERSASANSTSNHDRRELP